jgi:hypothetical protein
MALVRRPVRRSLGVGGSLGEGGEQSASICQIGRFRSVAPFFVLVIIKTSEGQATARAFGFYF